MVLYHLFNWKYSDVLNENLFRDRIAMIPNTFQSMEQWSSSFHYHLLEEFRASLAAEINNYRLVHSFQVDRLNNRENYVDIRATIQLHEDVKVEDPETDGGLNVVGVLSNRKLSHGSPFPLNAKNYFAKIQLRKKPKEKKDNEEEEDVPEEEEEEEDDRIQISNSFINDGNDIDSGEWKLHFFPNCSSVPFERVQVGLNDCESIHGIGNMLFLEMLRSVSGVHNSVQVTDTDMVHFEGDGNEF